MGNCPPVGSSSQYFNGVQSKTNDVRIGSKSHDLFGVDMILRICPLTRSRNVQTHSCRGLG